MTPSIITIVILSILFSGFRIAKEYERGVVFRLRRYHKSYSPGLYWLIPLGIDQATTIAKGRSFV